MLLHKDKILDSHVCCYNLLFSTQDGLSPLYVACQNGHKLTVDILLKNGANVNLAGTVSTAVH